jgi:hypothetical protein
MVEVATSGSAKRVAQSLASIVDRPNCLDSDRSRDGDLALDVRRFWFRVFGQSYALFHGSDNRSGYSGRNWYRAGRSYPYLGSPTINAGKIDCRKLGTTKTLDTKKFESLIVTGDEIAQPRFFNG